MTRPKHNKPVNSGRQKEAAAAAAKQKASENRATAKYAEVQKKAAAEKAALEAKLEEGFHYALVPALDALISEPKLIDPDKDSKIKAGEMLIPYQYVDRLEEFLDDGLTSRGEAAYVLLTRITDMLEKIHNENLECYTCANGMRVKFVSIDHQTFMNGDRKTSTKASALATAKNYNELNKRGDIAILSGDPAMLAKALLYDIDIARINPEIYTGRRKLVLPKRAYNKWFGDCFLTAEDFSRFFPDEKPLLYNEFVEFIIDDETAACYETTGNKRECRIGRFEEEYGEGGVKTGEWVLRQLHHIYKPKKNTKEIPIEPRNAGQSMLYEALLAPDIDIVICAATFGTGKTYLSVNTGLNVVRDDKSQYDRVFICPRDPHWGEQIGYLPGDERQKTLANAMPIVDNIRSGLKAKGDKSKGGEKKSNLEISNDVNKILDDWCELTSMVHMGGRSLANSWIIYDEAQDFEWSQMLQLVERIGEHSKMVIIGDPEQVHNKHLSKNSCGLSRAMTKFAGGKRIAVITLTKDEIERSEAAREIARLLNRRY